MLVEEVVSIYSKTEGIKVGLKFLANLRLKKNYLSKTHLFKAILISILLTSKEHILLVQTVNDCELQGINSSKALVYILYFVKSAVYFIDWSYSILLLLIFISFKDTHKALPTIAKNQSIWRK